MNSLIPHSRPTLPTGEEWREVTDRLQPGWIAHGEVVRDFERRSAGLLGGEGGVAVQSGTTALHLALLAAGAGPGREVLLPSYSCAALLHAVAAAGATPVLLDSEEGGFHLCAEDAGRKQTDRTAAVVAAHLFGSAVRVEPLSGRGLHVIEDCAQCLGAEPYGAPAGARGLLAIGSFYATKVITTGHGGLVSSRDAGLLEDLLDRVEYDNREDWKPRFSVRMSELPAALGLWQLERLPGFLERRSRLEAFFDLAVARSGAAGCRPPHTPGGICYRYVLRIPCADRGIEAFRREGIDARRPVYRPLHHYLGGDFPEAEAAHREIVSIPLYPALTDAEAERIAAALRRVLPCLLAP